MDTRAAIYTRQSMDRDGNGLAVMRQMQECERLTGSRGWTVTRRLSDNDISASSGKRRPAFEELMALVDAGQVDVIVTWAIDRLTRRLADLEDIITRCERTGVRLITASGDVDLSTDQGRLVARILASVARGEVERKGARQQLANQQRARNGKRRTACPRSFGYSADKVTPDPAEGPAVADAVRLINSGGSVSAIMREWMRAGLRPVNAPFGPLTRTAWTRQSIRVILLNPVIAGLSVYRGEIIGEGTWTPLVNRDEWEACRARLEDPARKPPRGVKTLLGGLARCTCGIPTLGGTNHLGTHVYRCVPSNRNAGAGPHVARIVADVDQYVSEVVIARLSRDDAADLLPHRDRADVAALSAEANAIRARRADLAAMFADGDLDRAALLAGTTRADTRLAEIEAKLADAASDSAVAPLLGSGDIRAAWNTLDLSRQRAVIDALMTVHLLSPGRGRRSFDPETVRIEWQAA